MPWSSSDRRSRLPKDWPKLVALVKERDGGRCTGIQISQPGQPGRWHVPECDGHGTEVDHVQRGDNHALTNLALLSTPCHKRKTFLEKLQCRRPVGRHPGLR